MANEERPQVLQQGADAWDARMRERREPTPDLSWAHQRKGMDNKAPRGARHWRGFWLPEIDQQIRL
jgi:hypothetical protein